MNRVVHAVGGAVLAGLWLPAAHAQPPRPTLSGTWEMNLDLSRSGAPPSFDDGRDERRGPPPGGRGPGGFGGAPRGGGFGGGGGPRGGGRTPPSAQEMEARRALFDEVVTLPRRFTLVQRDDAVTIVEADGVARTYATDNDSEKHQLTNGVVETRTRWDDGRLEMEISIDRLKLVRTFAIRDGATRQLAVTTAPRGGGRDREMVAVYEEVPR